MLLKGYVRIRDQNAMRDSYLVWISDSTFISIYRKKGLKNGHLPQNFCFRAAIKL